MRIKRWIGVIFLGVLLSNLGVAALLLGLLAPQAVDASARYRFALLFFVVGGIALVTGVYRLVKSLGELLGLKDRDKQLVDIAFERRYLGLGPKVVAMGGGTGMSVLLEGLKEYTSQVSAVVSVADDGGSSGRLRKGFDMLPPGDIRKCLVALADESSLLGDLMQYRFQEDAGELAGHSFGNLFLTVLCRLTGNFGEAVRQAGRVLSVRGEVIPATLDRVSLVAKYVEGPEVVGQRAISESSRRIRSIELKPNPGPASSEILEAIAEADLIVIGPGSLYTSVLPNMLIEGIPEAIASSEAVKVYVANVVSHEGETAGFGLKDSLDAFAAHVNEARVFDRILVNSGSPPAALLRVLETSGGKLVGCDVSDSRIVKADLIGNDCITRHDPRKLARALMALLAEAGDRN